MEFQPLHHGDDVITAQPLVGFDGQSPPVSATAIFANGERIPLRLDGDGIPPSL